ncbi:MAG: sulfur carrier protein ThiS [Bacteroidetes bacterium]|nr:sulfur carrier protein ThiS [Bacteroidota bacterium]
MKITLNNREENIERDLITIQELIEYKNFTFKLLVTKINDQLIKKDERKTTNIKDGDKVVVLHMISGG